MKYSVSIDIDLPRDRVVELFDNPDNMKHWMPGLVSFETFEGTPGQPGARSRLKFDMGKRKIEMVETISENQLPDRMTGTYETKGVWNSVEMEFDELEGGRTRITNTSDFQFDGFGMKVFSWLMPGMFKKQSLSYLKNFKAFAEGQGPG